MNLTLPFAVLSSFVPSSVPGFTTILAADSAAAVPPAAGAPPAPADGYLIFTLVVVSLFLIGALLWLLMGLARNPAWTIADAVSEEAGNQPATLPVGVKPIMVASSSRLIAMLGLIVLIGMSIGVGYGMIWSMFTHQQMQMQGLLSYFYGMAALFAPYAVNQLREAFSAFAPGTNPSPQPAATGAGSSSSSSSASSSSSSGAPAALPPPPPLLQPSVVLPALKQPIQPGA